MASTAALPEDSFAQAFIGERPKLTTTVLQARLKRSDLIANSLSNYFKERAVIEADYSKKLSKLHAKGHIVPDSYGLGHDSGFDAVLKSLEQELERQIRLHDNFGSRLESTVAASLKDTAKSGEASYRNHESAALSIANRLEDVNSKLQKAQGGKTTFRKGGDTTKLQSDVDDMQDSWMQTAPSYLNAAQRAEVGRLEEIQQNLAKYETLCSDLAREKMELSESSLMKVLGWDIAADLQTFLLKEGSANAAPVTSNQARRPPTAPSNEPSESGHLNRRNSIMGFGAARESTPSVRSGHSSHHQSERKGGGAGGGGFLSGLRKNKTKSRGDAGGSGAATVSGRGRSHSSAADSYGPIDESEPVPPLSSSVRAPPSGVADPPLDTEDAEMSALHPSIQPDASSATPQQEPGFAPQGSGALMPGGRTPSKRDSMIPSFFQRKSSNQAFGATPQRQGSGTGNELLSAEAQGAAATDSEPNSPAVFGASPQPPSMDPHSSQNTYLPAAATTAADREAASPSPTTSGSNPFAPIAGNGLAGMMAPKQAAKPQVDAEGYTIPPPNHDAQPWDAPGANGSASLMDDGEGMPPSSLPKLDIQPDMAPKESEAERQAALQRVQSTLQASGPGIGRRQTVNRGRRSQAHSMMFAPTTEPMPEEASAVSSSALNTALAPSSANVGRREPPVPPSRQTSSNYAASPVAMSMPASPSALNQSTSTDPGFLHSPTASVDGHAGSITSPSSNPFENPAGHGLRASITETLSVLSKSGQPPRAQVVGEVSLQLKEVSTSVEHFTLRFAQSESMDKLAPNNQILAVAAQSGSFVVQAKALQQACQTSAGPVVVLRYHLNLSPDQLAALPPLQLNSQWKCEPTLTSLIVNYAPNGASPLASTTSSTLTDLSLAVPITSNGVAQVQSKPAGMYHADRKRLLWRLEDLPLQPSSSGAGSGEHKVLARFQVEETSKPQPIAVKWSLPGRLVSPITLELVQDGTDSPSALDRIEEVTLRTVSGKYLCQ